ncbi:hypothetical protein LRS13_24720 [Svornostia abyssi]|uniref:Uncharacterized protein n=1 Tax=Svornostia abyssi TaxID=2898438 RepID=A0ABY5PGL1_9ACTN|nr:hypothetical protein LRS13_24720 [Parviterribacteraceae bacterium J379]
MRVALVLLAVLVAATAGAALALGWLGDDDDPPAARAPTTVTTTRTAARAPAVPALCRKLDEAVTGRVQDPALNELSGLVASRTRPGLLYSHEDSGAGPQVWALRTDGSVAGGWTVPGAEAVDWEDMATGPAPSGGGAVLYLGDIGDNAAARPYVDVYRVPEPVFGSGVTAPAERLRLRYPDGPRDAETLLVDPRRGTLVIVAKALTGARAYSVPASAFPGESTLRRGPEIDVALATAGDVSADGRTIAVRGYTSLAVWRRRGDEALTTTLRREPCSPPTALFEGQGEALALNRNGTIARTVAEGSPAVLRRYRAAR